MSDFQSYLAATVARIRAEQDTAQWRADAELFARQDALRERVAAALANPNLPIEHLEAVQADLAAYKAAEPAMNAAYERLLAWPNQSAKSASSKNDEADLAGLG